MRFGSFKVEFEKRKSLGFTVPSISISRKNESGLVWFLNTKLIRIQLKRHNFTHIYLFFLFVSGE